MLLNSEYRTAQVGDNKKSASCVLFRARFRFCERKTASTRRCLNCREHLLLHFELGVDDILLGGTGASVAARPFAAARAGSAAFATRSARPSLSAKVSPHRVRGHEQVADG